MTVSTIYDHAFQYSMADGRVTLRDDAATFALAKEFWERNRVCVWCHRKFNLLDSFGKWECKIHPQNTECRDYYESKGRKIPIQNGNFINVYKCCNKPIVKAAVFSSVISSLGMRRNHVRRPKHMQMSHTIWTGNAYSASVRSNFEHAQKIPQYVPSGCHRCDCRDIETKWKQIVKKKDGDDNELNEFDSGSFSNIQDFAPILALMTDVDSRPGFKNIDDKGNVSRIEIKER